MFAKLPVWGQITIVVLMCAGLVALAWKSYPNFSSMQSDIDGKQQEHDRLQAEIAKLP